jgi:septum formation protein
MSTAPLILASGSPRRRELLLESGVSFEVIISSVNELDPGSAPHLTPTDLALTNARLKAEAVAQIHPGRWILGADTVVVLGDRILGKPSSLAQAREFLRELGGRTHRVITACLLQSPDGSADAFHDESSVTFLPLTDEIIDRYLGAVEVLDKAGAYALQEKGDWIVAHVAGSRSNIIGLPMEKLIDRLHRHGLLL